MKKISEYRQHSEECRMLAQRADSVEHREMLLNMAATWSALADGRKRNLARQGSAESEEGGKVDPVAGLSRHLGGVAAAASDYSQARAEDEKAS
jgi:hypothetical protein